MEFWGVEVPSGKPLTCEPGPSSYVHVSQAALGENKNAKGNDRVVLKVKVGTNEVVVGTLSQGKCDQTTLDLIFEKDFVLSHSSSGSVYFCGYKTDAVRDDDSMSSGSDDDEFDMGIEEEAEDEEAKPPAKENGKMVTKPVKAAVPAAKPAAKSTGPKLEVPAVDAKLKVKSVAAQKGKGAKEKISEDDDEDEDSDEDDDSDDYDEMMGSDDEDVESDEDDSDDEGSEEEDVKSAGKKRPAPALQAANAGKKGKTDTPGKAEPKTPVPATTPKQQQSSKKDQSAKKTPGKENSNTPASGKKLGQFFCQPCSKNFNSESALSQHQTAKHKS